MITHYDNSTLTFNVNKEKTLVGRLRRTIKGGKFFKLVGDNLEEVVFEKSANIEGKTLVSKLYLETDCIYVEALNKQNAIKRIKQGKAFVYKP